mgnify:CR=1 FL=1
MKKVTTVAEALQAGGVTRRGFLKYCSAIASLMALPPGSAPLIAAALEKARRPSVIWLSFQECTGCTESLTRSTGATIEELIFNAISLDYHHTLQAASGDGAEGAREAAMHDHYGSYLLVVDGSIPLANPGFSTIAGISNLQMLEETVKGAAQEHQEVALFATNADEYRDRNEYHCAYFHFAHSRCLLSYVPNIAAA